MNGLSICIADALLISINMRACQQNIVDSINKVEYGLNDQHFNLMALVDRVFEVFKSIASAKQIELVKDVNQQDKAYLYMLFGNEPRFMRLITFFIAVACKMSQP